MEKLLPQCTDYNGDTHPNAMELKQQITDWININNSLSRQNLLQWQEVQEQLFPTMVPTHAEWHNINDIVNVLELLRKYNSPNHAFSLMLVGLTLQVRTCLMEQARQAAAEGVGLTLQVRTCLMRKHCIELHSMAWCMLSSPKDCHLSLSTT
ncbi:hypothetical protein, partial [Bacteroides pyogenes]